MKNTRTYIYDFNQYGLYFDDDSFTYQKAYTLVIDRLQLDVDYITGDLLFVYGFLVLIKAKRCEISLPQYEEGKFSIPVCNYDWEQGIGYDYLNYFPESTNYFIKDDLLNVLYDEKNKRILVGTMGDHDRCIKINKNLYCGFDKNNHLKYLLLCLDKIIPSN